MPNKRRRGELVWTILACCWITWKVTDGRRLNSHLWGGLFWHVHPPHLGFPRGGLLQKTRQPLASPGFQELHSFLPWLSLPPHWIQLPADRHITYTTLNTRLACAALITNAVDDDIIVIKTQCCEYFVDDTIPDKKVNNLHFMFQCAGVLRSSHANVPVVLGDKMALTNHYVRWGLGLYTGTTQKIRRS